MNQSSSMPGNPVPEKPEVPDFANRDPVSGEPGAHPVGTAVGGASGALLGAVAGTAVAGPIGSLIGSVIGVLAGSVAGNATGESINPTEQDAYWRERYSQEPYYEAGRSYEEYAAAYRTGYEAHAEHQGQTFDQAESALQLRYAMSRGTSVFGWDQARPATRAAWDRAARGTLV